MLVTTPKCLGCGKTHEIEVKAEDHQRWQAGEHAQHAFPYLDADQRELLISGTCKECWDEMFPPEDDDELFESVIMGEPA